LLAEALFLALHLMRLYRRRSREHAQTSADEILQHDTRRPIVYIRAYAEEHIRVKERRSLGSILDFLALGTHFSQVLFVGQFVRLEEVLANELWFLAPVIGIGDPHDSTHPLGASRTYFSDDVWREYISSRMKRAAILLVMPGLSQFIRWEIATACRAGLLEKCLFILPPKSVESRKKQIAALADCTAPALTLRLVLTQSDKENLISAAASSSRAGKSIS